MKQIKPFEQVKIGDIAFENPDAGGEWNNEEGPIIWKGTFEEVLQSRYDSELKEWEEYADADLDELKECNFVAVDLEIYGSTLFTYDYDPCSLVCFE